MTELGLDKFFVIYDVLIAVVGAFFGFLFAVLVGKLAEKKSIKENLTLSIKALITEINSDIGSMPAEIEYFQFPVTMESPAWESIVSSGLIHRMQKYKWYWGVNELFAKYKDFNVFEMVYVNFVTQVMMQEPALLEKCQIRKCLDGSCNQAKVHSILSAFCSLYRTRVAKINEIKNAMTKVIDSIKNDTKVMESVSSSKKKDAKKR